MSNLADRPIKTLHCHVGVQVGPQVVTSLDLERDGAVMVVTAIGVLIKSTRKMPGREVLIPWGHVGSVQLLEEAAPKAPTSKAK